MRGRPPQTPGVLTMRIRSGGGTRFPSRRGWVGVVVGSMMEFYPIPVFRSAPDRPLAPGDGHGRRLAVAVAADVRLTVLEPGHEPHQLLDRLLIRLLALLRR